MRSLLEPFSDKQVRIEQTGDTGISGRLVNIQADYASIWNGEQLTHYPYEHIKSVSADITELPVVVPLPDIELKGTFAELLETLVRKMVRIENGGGSRVGILSTVTSESISLIVGTKGLTMYPIGQVKNISPRFIIASGNDTQATDVGNHEAQQSSQSNRAGRETSSNTSSSSNSDASFSQSHQNFFNKKLATSMLEQLNVTWHTRQTKTEKYSNAKNGYRRSAVVWSASSPSLFAKTGKKKSRSK